MCLLDEFMVKLFNKQKFISTYRNYGAKSEFICWLAGTHIRRQDQNLIYVWTAFVVNLLLGSQCLSVIYAGSGWCMPYLRRQDTGIFRHQCMIINKNMRIVVRKQHRWEDTPPNEVITGFILKGRQAMMKHYLDQSWSSPIHPLIHSSFNFEKLIISTHFVGELSFWRLVSSQTS